MVAYKRLILLVFVLLTACSLDKKENTLENNRTNTTKYKPYFNLDAKLKQKIIKYISTIKIGTYWKDIKGEYKSYFKEEEIVGKKNNISRGKIRILYLKKLDKDLVNEIYDEYIYLIFDINDKLIEKIVKVK